jgi:hypothetical protein
MKEQADAELQVRQKQNQAKANPVTKIGLEEFLEDVFGLNIRSAKTIWTSFKKPSQYFDAARTPDWEQKYTPSLRLWLGLIAVMVAFQFIWARPDGTFMAAMREGLINGLKSGMESGSKQQMDLANFDFDAVFLDTMQLNTLLYPFIFIFFMSFLAFLYRAWGEKLPFVVRQRYIFAIIVPATVFGLFTTLLMTFASTEMFKVISLLQIGVVLGLYFITAYRGPYARMEAGEKFGRSLVLSISITITLSIVQMISLMIAMTIVLMPALQAYLSG